MYSDLSDAELLRKIIEAENYISEQELAYKNKVAEHKQSVDNMRGELLLRMNQTGVKTLTLDDGRVTRVQTTNYSVSDPEALLEYVKRTNSIAIFGTKLIKKAVESISEDGSMPAGISQHTVFSLRITARG